MHNHCAVNTYRLHECHEVVSNTKQNLMLLITDTEKGFGGRRDIVSTSKWINRENMVVVVRSIYAV